MSVGLAWLIASGSAARGHAAPLQGLSNESASSSGAGVEDETLPDGTDTQPVHWYGWQTLSVDALPAVLWTAAVPAEDQAEVDLLAFGGLSFALGAPIVHVGHGREGTALASLSLRLAMPVAGAFVGSRFDGQSCVDDEQCTTQTAFLAAGVTIGAAGASLIDGLLLAFEPVPTRRETTSQPGVRAVPVVALAPGRLGVGLNGSF